MAVADLHPARDPDVPGLSIDWLFKSPTIRITAWKCVVNARGITPERVQPWHVIGFPHFGSYALYSRGRATLIDPTRIVFFNAMSPYQTSHPCGCGDRGSSLVVDRKTLSEILAEYDPPSAEKPEAPFAVSHAESSSKSYLLMRLLFSRLRSGLPVDPFEVEEMGLRLAAQAIRALSLQASAVSRSRKPRPLSARRDMVENVKTILAGGFRRPQRLEEIARAVGSSPFHLCRTFKSATGLPVHRYLNRLRLRASLAPLARGSTDLTGLALALGYSSHSHFTEAFQKEFGIAPSRFRGLASSDQRRKLSDCLPLEIAN
jgi:AraC-like DNA-binding protein